MSSFGCVGHRANSARQKPGGSSVRKNNGTIQCSLDKEDVRIPGNIIQFYCNLSEDPFPWKCVPYICA